MKWSQERTRNSSMALGALLLALPVGCARDVGIARPDEEPNWSRPAQPEATEATGGVTTWEIYRQGQGYTVLGIDSSGVPITDTRISVEGFATPEETLEVKSVVPQDGVTRFKPDGTVLEDDMAWADSRATAGSVMEEMARLFDSESDGALENGGCGKSCEQCVEMCRRRKTTCQQRCGSESAECTGSCRRQCKDTPAIPLSDGTVCVAGQSGVEASKPWDDASFSSSTCEAWWEGVGQYFSNCWGIPLQCVFIGCKKPWSECNAWKKHWHNCTDI